MFDAKFNHESRFFVDGYELSGVENVAFSYQNPTSISKFMGTTNGFVTLNGPTNQNVSFSRVLTYSDPILNYTGDSPVSGSLYYEDKHYGFESGYLLDYSLNCAVGSVPRASVNIQIADELETGKSEGKDESVHPNIDIPTQGSIKIQADNASSNRVVGFDYSLKCNRKAYLTIGNKDIAKVELIYPIEYSATVQIDVDDAFMEQSNSFLSKTGERNISLSVDGRNGSSIQNIVIPNAHLVSESLTASANGALKLNLQYVGSVGKDLSSLDYSRTFAVDNNKDVISYRDAVIEDDWQKGNQDVYALYFGTGLTAIGDEAFSGCSNLDFLPTIPLNLEEIGNKAFKDCANIESDLFFDGDSITGIDYQAFQGCTSLNGELFLPDSLTYLGFEAFQDCSSIESLRLSDNLDNIEASTFRGCYGIQGELNIPDSVGEIKFAAFSGCNGLNSINIGQSISEIDGHAFNNCYSLAGELKIPDSTTGIRYNSFTDCSLLNSLSIGQSVELIGFETFRNCSGLSNTITFPKSLQIIEARAFQDCANIKGLEFFDNKITYFNSFEQYPFGEVTKEEQRSVGNFGGDWVSALLFPNLADRDFSVSSSPQRNSKVSIVSTEGNSKLQGTRALEIRGSRDSVAYPLNFIKIKEAGYYIFEVSFKTENSEFRIKVNNNIIYQQSDPQGRKQTLYYGTPLQVGDVINLEVYNSDIGVGENKAVIIGHIYIRKHNTFPVATQNLNLTDIKYEAFSGCENIKGEINLTKDVTVESSAFRDCKNIERVSFGDGVTINSSAFRACRGLKGDVIFEDSTSNIGNYSFFNCKGLDGSLYLPTGLTYLGNNAFDRCDSFSGNLIIENCSGLNGIRDATFTNCKFSNQLILPQNPDFYYINERAFKNCGFTGELVLPTGLTHIGYHAFYNNLIGDVYSDVPHSAYKDTQGVASVDSDIFYNATGSMYITSRYYDDYVRAVENYRNQFLDYEDEQGESGLIFQGMPIQRGSRRTQLYRASDDVVTKQDKFDIPDSWNLNNGTTSYIDIDEECQTIGWQSFKDSSMTGDLILPRDLTFIGWAAFENSVFDGYLQFNDKLEFVNGRAFNNCYGFTGDLILSDSITGIGEYAFQNCSGFNGKLSLPENITFIGRGAFENLTGLDSDLTIPTGIETIEEDSFRNCNLKGRLSIPVNIELIESSAFEGNDFNENLWFPKSVTGISNSAFKDCRKIRKVNYNYLENNDGVGLTIGSSAFENCVGIVERLDLKRKLQSVGQNAFKNCSGISVCHSNIPQSKLGAGALKFQDQPTSNKILSVESANIQSYLDASALPPQLAQGYYDGNLIRPRKADEFNTIYYDENFAVLASGRWDDFAVPEDWQEGANGRFLDLGASLTGIKHGAFQNNSSLSGVVLLPNSMVTLESSALRSTKVESFVLNNGLETIGDYTFANSVVKEWSIPGSVKSIGNFAFRNNDEIEKFIAQGENLNNIGNIYEGDTSSVFEYDHNLEIVDIGYDFVPLGESFTLIKDNAFNRCGRDKVGLGDVTLRSSILRVGKNCFDGTTANNNHPWLKKVTLNCTEVQDNAFLNQTNLDWIQVNDKFRIAGSGAFANCSSLFWFYFRGNNLRNYAFSGCSSLKNVTIDPSFGKRTYVASECFSYAGGSATNGRVILRHPTTVYSNAFRNKVSNPWIKYLETDASLIGSDSFRNQSSITDITWGVNSKNINPRAFMGCTSITGDVIIEQVGSKIKQEAFDLCPVRDVYLNTNRSNISGNAFNDMTGDFYVASRIIDTWTGDSPIFDNGRPINVWTSYPDPMP